MSLLQYTHKNLETSSLSSKPSNFLTKDSPRVRDSSPPAELSMPKAPRMKPKRDLEVPIPAFTLSGHVKEEKPVFLLEESPESEHKIVEEQSSTNNKFSNHLHPAKTPSFSIKKYLQTSNYNAMESFTLVSKL